MILKAIDLSLMAEHLTTHKGILHNLQLYYCSVKEPDLKNIIYDQFLIMRNHVQVMLMLIDPTINEQVSVSALDQIQSVEIPCQPTSPYMGDDNIAIDGKHIAMSMALGNFSSALKMKAANVKDIHVHMALQQVKIQERYSNWMESNGLENSPSSSLEEQIKTLDKFKNFYHIQ